MLKFGVDRAAEFSDLFTGRVALVTSPTGRNSAGQSTASVLRQICNLQLLLAPEHGIRGDRAAGEVFGADVDDETGLRVLSMYTGGSKRLPKEAFDCTDTLVYDIQDVGCRYYTFISTLKALMEDCAAYGKRLIVLDRPNPLGSRVEGSILRRDMQSFVGCHTLPVCYGLTCGEFARMVNAEENCGCDLHVIPCTGLDRTMTFPDWQRPWVKPSPNIPDYETALLYPGTCLIEGTNLSEGRGTDAPLIQIGAPFVDGDVLCREFQALGLPGVTGSAVQFTPQSSKHAGVACGGIRFHVTDAAALRPTELGIRLLKLLQTLYPKEMTWLPGENGVPFVSWLAGHRELEKPDWDADALIRTAEAEREEYLTRADAFRIYE